MQRVNCVSEDAQKENPPAASGGLSELENNCPLIDSQIFDNACHSTMQSLYIVETVINVVGEAAHYWGRP